MGRIYETPPYLCDASALTEVDRASIRDALTGDPLRGDLIAGAEGFRIVRFATFEKLHEWVVMTLYVEETDSLYLLALFEPGDSAELSLPEQREVAAAAARALASARPKTRRFAIVR